MIHTELWLIVFSYVSNLGNVLLVSKYWYMIIKEELRVWNIGYNGSSFKNIRVLRSIKRIEGTLILTTEDLHLIRWNATTYYPLLARIKVSNIILAGSRYQNILKFYKEFPNVTKHLADEAGNKIDILDSYYGTVLYYNVQHVSRTFFKMIARRINYVYLDSDSINITAQITECGINNIKIIGNPMLNIDSKAITFLDHLMIA